MGIALDVRSFGFFRLLARLAEAEGKWHLAPHRVVEEGAEVMVEALRTEAPKRTGFMASTIRAHVEGDRARFTTGVRYSVFVRRGTAPHEIRAGFYGKRALWWAGAHHPVRRVFHPGNAPNPFPRRALALAKADIMARAHHVAQWVLGK
jgi:hypothetical protein